MERLENDKYYRYCTYAYIPFQYASVIAGAYLFTASDLSWLGYDGPLNWPAKIGLALSFGMLGGIGINTAHELGHKKDSLERWLSKITLAQTCTGTSTSSTTAATMSVSPPRKIRPRRGSANVLGVPAPQSLGHPALGLAVGGPADAPAEQESVQYRQRCAQRVADVGGVLGGAGGGFRPGVDSVRDHSGGRRVHPAGGGRLSGALRAVAAKDAPLVNTGDAAPEHSWNSDHLVTNLFLYHLQRHSDHHVNSTRRYQSLRSVDGAPSLPSGYASMISLTYFPPLWRRVMDHRVLEHYDGDITRVNLTPAGARRSSPATALGQHHSKDRKHMIADPVDGAVDPTWKEKVGGIGALPSRSSARGLYGRRTVDAVPSDGRGWSEVIRGWSLITWDESI